MSIWTEKARFKLGSIQTELKADKEAVYAIEWMARCMPSPGSPDYKPDDPEYKALRAHASTTLEAFSQFLSTATAIELANEVDDVFDILRDHGEKAGLLSPPLIRAMSRYLDAYKKERGELPLILEDKEEWIRTLYHNLKPDDSEQVCSLPFLLYEFTLTSNFTLTQNPNTAVVASASANAADSDNPPVQSAVAAADITTNCASDPIPSVQGASSALPEGSYSEASLLASFPAPSTAQIQESASVEPTQGVPRAEDTPAPQEDSGYARADPDEVSETPAQVRSGGTSDTNPQETESPSGSFLAASRSRLTSLPAPSTARAEESASAEPTLRAPMSEDTRTPQADPGPAQTDSDEVSETFARPNQDRVSETPALVGSGGTSDADPQETELFSTEIPSLPRHPVQLYGHADPSE